MKRCLLINLDYLRIEAELHRSGITYSYRLKVEGDYIYLRRFQKVFFSESSESLCFVYKKSDEKVPEDWKKYPADW